MAGLWDRDARWLPLPSSEGEKFDPQGDYIHRWCPEFARLPDKWIHQTWAAPEAVFQATDVWVGKNYPAPIVSHAIAREVAREAYVGMRATK